MSDITPVLRVSAKASRISLKITPKGLFVVSPRNLSTARLSQIVSDNHEWISKHIHRITTKAVPEKLSILGVDTHITYVSTRIKKVTEVAPGKLEIPNIDTSNTLLTKWLRRKAKEYLENRAYHLADLHNFHPRGIAIRDQGTRWGSCSSNGNLNFSWRLILAPLYVSDYVILHELCHLRQMNHSEAFWNEVRALDPSFKLAKSWLKSNGHILQSV